MAIEPCPICGDTPERAELGPHYYVVFCADVGSAPDHDVSASGKTPEEAVTAWNRRSPSAGVAALEAQLGWIRTWLHLPADAPWSDVARIMPEQASAWDDATKALALAERRAVAAEGKLAELATLGRAHEAAINTVLNCGPSPDYTRGTDAEWRKWHLERAACSRAVVSTGDAITSMVRALASDAPGEARDGEQ